MFIIVFVILVIAWTVIEDMRKNARYNRDPNYRYDPILSESPTGADLRATYRGEPTAWGREVIRRRHEDILGTAFSERTTLKK
jgi:hypothetical protein